jgi:hypothetical protein
MPKGDLNSMNADLNQKLHRIMDNTLPSEGSPKSKSFISIRDLEVNNQLYSIAYRLKYGLLLKFQIIRLMLFGALSSIFQYGDPLYRPA